MTAAVHDVVVIGGPDAGRAVDALRRAGFSRTSLLENGADVVDSTFDEDGHTWTLHTPVPVRARIVVTTSGAPRQQLAVPGVPNRFVITAPDDARLAEVVRCLRLMDRTVSTRIEARPRRAVDFFRWRRRLAFDLGSRVESGNEVYDGPANIKIGGDSYPVRVRLTGHLEPIDGRYHWQGTVFGPLPDVLQKRSAQVEVNIGERTAPGRITERMPWGTHSVAGVGAPPFPLDDVEIAIPIR